MKESSAPRTQLDNGFQIPILLLFTLPLIVFIVQPMNYTHKMQAEDYLFDGIFLLIYGVFASRLMNVKNVSFDSENFYIRSLFKNNEISIPISRITLFKKAAFISFGHTDMFLIRYTNYDSKGALVKFLRHRDHISILRFRELIKKNDYKVDGLRGIVENKF